MRDSAEYAGLGFVEIKPDESVDFWAPAQLEDYAEACACGRQYGEQLHNMMKATGNPMLFGSVVRAMTARGIFDAVEIGFCGYFSIASLGLRVAPETPEN